MHFIKRLAPCIYCKNDSIEFLETIPDYYLVVWYCLKKLNALTGRSLTNKSEHFTDFPEFS